MLVCSVISLITSTIVSISSMRASSVSTLSATRSAAVLIAAIISFASSAEVWPSSASVAARLLIDST